MVTSVVAECLVSAAQTPATVRALCVRHGVDGWRSALQSHEEISDSDAQHRDSGGGQTSAESECRPYLYVGSYQGTTNPNPNKTNKNHLK